MMDLANYRMMVDNLSEELKRLAENDHPNMTAAEICRQAIIAYPLPTEQINAPVGATWGNA